MELEGAKRCFCFLKNSGATIPVFISDRHMGIAKWLREDQPTTKHFFDIWHVAKSLTKKILKASKEKGSEILKDWLRGIKNHLYWSVTSTKSGFEAMIKAKWLSIMQHVTNRHTEHSDKLYPNCIHGELEKRDYIKVGRLCLNNFTVIEKFESLIMCYLVILSQK